MGRKDDEVRQSALSRVEVGPIPVTHEDERRSLVEIFSSPEIIISDFKVIDIKQPPAGGDTEIGGHWEKGVEIQYVNQGKISRLHLADVQTGEERIWEQVPTGSKIFLPAGVAHRLIFTEPAQILVGNEVPFDPIKCVIYPFRRNTRLSQADHTFRA